MPRRVLVALCLTLLVGGCAPSARVSWEIVLGETAGAARWIVVERRAGDCAGPIVEQRVVAREDASSSASSSIALPAGPQAFAATVLDAECRRIGQGCVDLVLDRSSPSIRVLVAAQAPVACGEACPVEACSGPGSDAGPFDGGRIDAGTLPDARGVADAAVRVDATLDARALDARGDAGGILACRGAATSEPECQACPGLWCMEMCCRPEWMCCTDGCRPDCGVPP